MADKEIKSLRVSAEMDASKYVSGTKQMETANKSLADSTKQLGSNVVQLETKISQAGDPLARLSKQFIDGYGAQQRFSSGLSQLQRGLDTGKISIEQASNILVGMNQKLGLTGDVTALVARGQTSLAAAMGIANTTIAAQTGALSRHAGEWQIYIAQLKEAQAAQNSVQIASANQNRFNSLLGVQTQPSSSARESASAFQSGFTDFDEIAKLKSQQIGQNFSAGLEASLVAGSSKSARDAASVFSTELDRIDEIAKLKSQQIGANFQSDLNASFGIGAGGGSARASASVFEEAGREADQMAASVARLRAELNPLGAAQDRLNAELAEYDALAAKGAISTQELAQAQALARSRAANNNSQGGLGRFGAMNATSQFQDIAVTAAMGQSPLTIALQQGTQLGMALQMQMGDQGAKGVIKGLGTAFMGLLSPVNLLAIGLTGVVAVAIQFGSKLLPQVKSLKDATEDQRKAVTDLAAAYGDAGLKADDFYKKSIIASESAARRSTGELRKSSSEADLTALGSLVQTQVRGRGVVVQDVTNPAFAAFNDPIKQLMRDIRAGRPDYDAFEKSIAGVVAQNPGLQTTADKILDIVGAATEAASRLGKTADYIKDINRASVGNFDRSAQAGRDQSVMSQRFGDDPFAKEREQERQKVIALKEAQDERNRSLDRTLASARQDVELVGKTTAEVEGLRLAVQLEAQVREEAAKNNVKADETEIANIRAKAVEYGKLKAQQEAATTIKSQQDDLELQRAEIGAVGQNQLAHDALIATLKTEMEIRKLGADAIGGQADEMRANTAATNANAEALAHATMQSDLLFQRRQILRNSEDQQIASALKSAGLPDDLNSQEAQMMRFNMALQESKDTFKGFFSDMFSGLKEGKTLWESFKDAAVNALSKIADKLIDRGLDGIFNSIFGGEGQTSNGGLLGQLLNSGNSGSSQQSGSTSAGGILGSILGGRNQSASSMQVQAGVVYVNGAAVGGVGGGLSDILSKLGSPSFKANTTLSDILGYGGAANDNANQDYIQSRINGAFGTSGGLGGIFSGGAGLTGSMSSYAAAIRSIESAGSGGYSALGPVLKSGDQALGAYQVMRSNLPSWSTQAFGKPMSQSEFLSNPSAQDAIFSQQFGKSLSKYGNPQDAASAWFTGGPLSAGAGKMDVLGTTGSKYVDKFNTALEKVGGTASSASGALNSLGGASEGLISQFSKMGQSLLSQLTPATSGSSWFQGLSGMFGGSSGALGFMNSISPAATGDILSGSWGLFANGAAFRHGNVVPFANGDVFSRPTYFPMSGGKTGVMGEAGDEAIMPLRRGPDGKLGVAAHTQKAANDRPHQTINQTNNFIFRENPAAPASQNQIAAKSAKSLERLTRVS